MKHLRQLLGDRRRRQRGSVLSGVLIIVAFLSIIGGALMTELSTNFLISRALVNRVSTEATVNSAMELAIDQLQNSPLPIDSGCPKLSSPAGLLNGQPAALTQVSCAPVVEHGLQLQPIDTTYSGGFRYKGSHIVMSNPSRNEYLVASSGGTLFAYSFGSSSHLWPPVTLGGWVTGPPTAIPDVSTSPRHISNLVPIGGSCGATPYCVALLAETPGLPPALTCFMPANDRVWASPAAEGMNFPNLVFFGDNSGRLFAYDHTELGGCSRKQFADAPAAIVAGPVVFTGAVGSGKKKDELYFVTWDGSVSQLLHYTYTETAQGSKYLAPNGSWYLTGSRAAGLTLDQAALPARMAITFADGEVATTQILAGYGITPVLTKAVAPNNPDGPSIADAPYWCHCPGGDLIGTGAFNGTLYLLDTNLGQVASYGPSAAIYTAPAADSAGDWFFGADDGYVYEVQRVAGQTALSLVDRFPASVGSRIGSGVQVGICGTGGLDICIYLATRPGSVYLVPLAARRAVLTACIGTYPACSPGVNPRLWASVEVGSQSKQQAVRVTGWSYYSP